MTTEDQKIAYQVERAIRLLPDVSIGDLRVTADKGRVRIQGVVNQLSDKEKLLEAALRVPGVVAVDEGVAVETPVAVRDQELSETYDERLEAEAGVDLHRLGGEATHGQALLLGEARSVGELARAVETTAEVPSTSNVIDTTRIANPYGTDRIDLANAIANALRAHPVLRHRAIRAIVEDTGKVLLTGEVRSLEEKEKAVAVAAEVPGAHTVREELIVIP